MERRRIEIRSVDRLRLELKEHNIPLSVIVSDYVDLKFSFKRIASNLKKEGITIANERNVRELIKSEVSNIYKKGRRIKENSYAFKLQEKERELELLKMQYESNVKVLTNKIEKRNKIINQLQELNKYLFEKYIKAYEKQGISNIEFEEVTEYYKNESYLNRSE